VATASSLRGVSTVSFFAADHAAARKWYTEFLGVEPYFERPGYVEFRLGDYQHELGIIDSKYVPGVQSNNGRAGVVVYWHVDDVNAELEKAVAMGATQLEPPKTVAMALSPPRWWTLLATSWASCTTRITWRS
jgi:predicted enzyme related to lactoylglutathione lyase